MSDTATVSTETATYRRPSGLNAIYQDSRVIAWRNLVHLPRTPQLVIFTLIQPIMFVLLFTYVFGGAIGKALPPGVSYAQFLIPGIMVQTLVFGTSATAVGLAEDLQNGIIDRFRSLPISRSAVLNGRILADMIRTTDDPCRRGVWNLDVLDHDQYRNEGQRCRDRPDCWLCLALSADLYQFRVYPRVHDAGLASGVCAEQSGHLGGQLVTCALGGRSPAGFNLGLHEPPRVPLDSRNHCCCRTVSGQPIPSGLNLLGSAAQT